MHPQLTDLDYLQSFLAQHGITPERSAGQNFLVCEEPLEAMLAALDGGGESVTELGAGVGPLTAALAVNGYAVRAIERDPALAALLPKHIPPKTRARVEVRVGDLRDEAWEWEKKWQLVGNIPYNLSGFIIRRLTELPHQPTQAIFMVQREVGQRLAAAAPDMNLLALAAQLWGSVHLLLNVPRSCFWPAPEVDSSVVLLAPHPSGPDRAERDAVLRLARVFFQHKRKQMGGVGKRALGWTAPEATLGAAGIAGAARPQDVSVAQWRQLAAAVGRK